MLSDLLYSIMWYHAFYCCSLLNEFEFDFQVEFKNEWIHFCVLNGCAIDINVDMFEYTGEN